MQDNPKIKLISMECLECIEKDKTIAQLTKEIEVLKSEVATLQSKIQDVKKSEEIIQQETWELLNITSNKIDDMLSQCISYESIQQKQLSSDDIFKSTIIDNQASATLIQYLLKQTNNQKTTLNCICQRKLSVENLKYLFNYYHYNMISNQLFNNQIKELKEICKEKIGCCKNRFCHFFFIAEKKQQSYCPLCLC